MILVSHLPIFAAFYYCNKQFLLIQCTYCMYTKVTEFMPRISINSIKFLSFLKESSQGTALKNNNNNILGLVVLWDISIYVY